MKSYEKIYNDMLQPAIEKDPTNGLADIKAALFFGLLRRDSKLSAEDAVKVVERYLLLQKEVGAPLLMEEAAIAMTEVLEEQSLQDTLEMDLTSLKVALAAQADKSFQYALEGDRVVAEALGY